MRSRILDWLQALWPRAGVGLIIYAILRLVEKVFEDRLLGWINRLLDPYGGRALSLVREILLWSTHSPVGITGVVFAAVILALLIHAYFETRPTVPGPPSVAPSEGAPKGFLDFQVDAERIGTELGRAMRQFLRPSAKFRARLNVYTRQIHRLRGNPKGLHKLAGRASSVMDTYSTFLETMIPRVEATGKEFIDTSTSYSEWIRPSSDGEKRNLDEYRNAVGSLLSSIKDLRKVIRSTVTSVAAMRQANISQSLNRAGNRMLVNYQRLEDFYESFEKGLTKLLSILKRKLKEDKTRN